MSRSCIHTCSDRVSKSISFNIFCFYYFIVQVECIRWIKKNMILFNRKDNCMLYVIYIFLIKTWKRYRRQRWSWSNSMTCWWRSSIRKSFKIKTENSNRWGRLTLIKIPKNVNEIMKYDNHSVLKTEIGKTKERKRERRYD